MDSQNLHREYVKDYHSNVVHGGTAHFGDNYQFNYGPSPDQRAYERFLDSLRGPHMFSRENQITDQFPKTFEWIFNEGRAYRFTDWLRNTNSNTPFYIAGKPGSGKSTLMKFLANHSMTKQFLQNSNTGLEVIVLKFYFWLIGSVDQNSTKGCLTSLLFQLAVAMPKMVMRYLSINPSIQQRRYCGDWSVPDQQRMLCELLLEAKSCIIFLDGIDEFDKDGDLDQLWKIMEQWLASGAKLCISSRPEPEILEAVSTYPTLRLQDLTYHDILLMTETRLEQSLKKTRNFSQHERALKHLVRSIAMKSDGVFLWACLVIESLVRGLKYDDTMELLEQRLELLPSRLEDLYAQMWRRMQSDAKRLYLDEARLYFALARMKPHSLLTFTLATNEALARRMIQSKTFSKSFVDEIIEACHSTARKLWSRTGGLLECVSMPRHLSSPILRNWQLTEYDFLQPVQSEFNQKDLKTVSEQISTRSTGASQNLSRPSVPLCSCGLYEGWVDKYSPSPRLRYICDSAVDFVHRSAVEFVEVTDDLEFLKHNEKTTLAAIQGFALSYTALRVVGLGVTDFWEHFIPRSFGDKWYRPSIFDISTIVEKELQQAENHRFCLYGMYHPSYLQVFAKNIFDRSYFSVLPDVVGELVEISPDLVQTSLSRVRNMKMSAYYHGYLLLCGAMTIYRFSNLMTELKAVLGRQLCSLMCWLLRTEIDTQTQHVLVGRSWMYIVNPHKQCLTSLLGLVLATYSQTFGFFDELKQALSAVLVALKPHACQPADAITIVVEGSFYSHGAKLIIVEAKVSAIEEFLEQCFDSEQSQGLGHEKIHALAEQLRITHLVKTIEPERFSKLFRLRSHGLFTALMNKYQILESTKAHRDERDCPEHKTLYTILQDLGLVLLIEFGRITPWDTKNWLRLVPPDMTREIDVDSWYEYGELREWHERRRRGLVDVPNYVEVFEDKHGLTPSYRRTQIA